MLLILNMFFQYPGCVNLWKAAEKTVESISGGLRWHCQTDDLVLEEERVWGTVETSGASLR